MKKLNKKGFTLMELLAVIVVLAVIMLLASQAVLPTIAKARKGSLGTEGIALRDAAMARYTRDQLIDASFVENVAHCYTVEDLYPLDFTKGPDDHYKGSVKITKKENGAFDYEISISNGNFKFVKRKAEELKNADNGVDGDLTAEEMCTSTAKKSES